MGVGCAKGKLLGVQLCLLTIQTLKSSFLVPKSVTVFGDGSYRCNELRCCCAGVEWTLKQYDWWPYQKKKKEIWTQTGGMSCEY